MADHEPIAIPRDPEAVAFFENPKLPKMPSLGTPLFHFIHMLVFVEFAKRIYQKAVAKNWILPTRGEVNSLWISALDMYNREWFIDFFEPEFVTARFTPSAILHYEKVLKLVALSGMWVFAADEYFQKLDTQYPGLGLNQCPDEQINQRAWLLSRRHHFKRYCFGDGAWFLIDYFNSVTQDDGGFDEDEFEVHGEGITEEEKDQNNVRWDMALKHKFALYQQDRPAYKANRNSVRERFYAAWEAEDKVNEQRRSALQVGGGVAGSGMDVDMGEAGEDVMDLD